MLDPGNDPQTMEPADPTAEIGAIHDSCGVFTTPALVSDILDRMGWTATPALSSSGRSLLEPCAGEGAFVVEAGVRLVASFRAAGKRADYRALSGRIVAVEFHEPALRLARRRVETALVGRRVSPQLARKLAERWVIGADFLTMPLVDGSFTDVVGNPPYLRWSKVPKGLRSFYEDVVPREFARGDLFVPFLDGMLRALASGGRLGVVCSDRWRYMGFAEAFRTKWVPLLDVRSEEPVDNERAFGVRLGTQVTVLIARKRATPAEAAVPEGETLASLGFRFRSGPALGHSGAFRVALGDTRVEPERRFAHLVPKDIGEGVVAEPSGAVVSVHEESGPLVSLQTYPKLGRHLRRHRKELEARYVVTKAGRPWFTTIDKVRAADWSAPKLLVPEISRTPRVALDESGAVPSHGIYAIFHPERDRLAELYERLRDGGLLELIEHLAPKVNGGYYRCYGKVLERVRL